MNEKIEELLKTLKHGKEVSDRRNAIWTLEELGSKDPEMAREFVPILMGYVK